MKTKFLTLLSVSFLLSCSGKFDSSSNLDAKNFANYFAPSNVEIYTSIDAFNGQYKYIGLVEGEACQAKEHHAKPDEIIARTEARKKASELKANAIIFTGCTLLTGEGTTRQCVASTICYGQAYFVEPSTSKN